MLNKDRQLGALLLSITLLGMAYYTFWVLILPFVDDDHFVQTFFPPVEWALRLPLAIFCAMLSFCVAFVGALMLRS
ncbi:MAG: hypothetical protein MHM6MM_003279 [Cercozoa sp. M6MM]